MYVWSFQMESCSLTCYLIFPSQHNCNSMCFIGAILDTQSNTYNIHMMFCISISLTIAFKKIVRVRKHRLETSKLLSSMIISRPGETMLKWLRIYVLLVVANALCHGSMFNDFLVWILPWHRCFSSICSSINYGFLIFGSTKEMIQ